MYYIVTMLISGRFLFVYLRHYIQENGFSTFIQNKINVHPLSSRNKMPKAIISRITIKIKSKLVLSASYFITFYKVIQNSEEKNGNLTIKLIKYNTCNIYKSKSILQKEYHTCVCVCECVRACMYLEP